MMVEVRIARPGDAMTMGSLIYDLLVELHSGTRPSKSRKALGQLAAELVAWDARYWVLLAFVDEKPVGLAGLNECAAIYAGGQFGEITELFVVPRFRSLGVARDLLKAVTAFGIEKGWRRLEVGAPPLPKWKRSIEFYLQNEFIEIGPRLRRDLSTKKELV